MLFRRLCLYSARQYCCLSIWIDGFIAEGARFEHIHKLSITVITSTGESFMFVFLLFIIFVKEWENLNIKVSSMLQWFINMTVIFSRKLIKVKVWETFSELFCLVLSRDKTLPAVWSFCAKHCLLGDNNKGVSDKEKL